MESGIPAACAVNARTLQLCRVSICYPALSPSWLCCHRRVQSQLTLADICGPKHWPPLAGVDCFDKGDRQCHNGRIQGSSSIHTAMSERSPNGALPCSDFKAASLGSDAAASSQRFVRQQGMERGWQSTPVALSRERSEAERRTAART